jgi:hypothetical protein
MGHVILAWGDIIYVPHYMIHIKKYKVLSSTENTNLKL